jgi:hypothetical protein
MSSTGITWWYLRALIAAATFSNVAEPTPIYDQLAAERRDPR